jgi:hypothetical protein
MRAGEIVSWGVGLDQHIRTGESLRRAGSMAKSDLESG